jgi:hypothetical protein
MFVVIRIASSLVTMAHTSAGSSLRTTLSSSPAVSQATAGWLLNSAASWPLSSSQPRTRASFSPTSAARLMGQGRRARPRLARTG